MGIYLGTVGSRSRKDEEPLGSNRPPSGHGNDLGNGLESCVAHAVTVTTVCKFD